MQKIKPFILLFCLLAIAGYQPVFALSVHGDEHGEVLFRVGDETVDKSEFLYVYQKNNPGKQNDYSRESLEEYLDLYINFKLKVKEAKNLQIDTLDNVRGELDRYRNQLIRSYYDKEVTEKMVEEIYDRLLYEVEVSHIMLGLPPNVSPEDTLEAYNKLQEVRKQLLEGADFKSVAMEVSQDPSVKENAGYLGYITALMIPEKAFEDAAYDTPSGELSEVIRTRYGYHIVKPGKRRDANGKMQVAHILFKIPANATGARKEEIKAEAAEVYDQLMEGASFDSLAREYSDDRATADKGGVLPPFSVGKMVATFESAAFSLEKDGDISKPVKTSYGWHIIKRLSKTPIGSFEDMKSEINRQLQRTGRYEARRDRFIENSKEAHNFSYNDSLLNHFKENLDSSILKNDFTAGDWADHQGVLFTIGDKQFTLGEFAQLAERSQRAYRDMQIGDKVDRLFSQFVDDEVIEYALANKYEDFRRLLKEYRDGILLFELTEEKVWSKAIKDTAGLEAFYERNKDNYMWGERVEASIYTVADEKLAKKVHKKVRKGSSYEEIEAKYNTDDSIAVAIEHGKFVEGANELVDARSKEVGVSDISPTDDGRFLFVEIERMVPPTNKSLEEARGYVISDYQDYLEQEWIRELRSKYEVKVNEEVFNSLVK